MTFVRGLGLFAVFAIVADAVFVAAVSAGWLTLDPQTLRIVVAAITVVVTVVVPVVIAGGMVKSAAARGYSIRKAPTALALVGALNAIVLGTLLYTTPAPAEAVQSGWTALVVGDTVDATEATPPVGGEEQALPVPEPGEPKGIAASKSALTKLLDNGAPTEVSEGLTHESAAAVGVYWMAFLAEVYGDDLPKVGGAAYSQLLSDYSLQHDPGIWRDPAALEPTVVPRGRAFYAQVAAVVDAVAEREGPVPLTWPILPEQLLASAAVDGRGAAFAVTYTEVAMNRVEIDAGRKLDSRFQDRAWRIHVGDYGEIATRRANPAAVYILMRQPR